MGDSLDDMIALRKIREEEARVRKRANLEAADTSLWQPLSPTHYRRMLSGGGYVDWWPTTRKFGIIGKGASAFRARYRVGDPNDFIAKHRSLEWQEVL